MGAGAGEGTATGADGGVMTLTPLPHMSFLPTLVQVKVRPEETTD